jgi:signal transduction histidine kinase/CheY-like chemotaxis protein
MDLLTLAIELVFAVLFAAALRTAIVRRDRLAANVALVFLPLTFLFVMTLAGQYLGPPHPIVSAAAIILIFAQPVLTLALVAGLRHVPAWLLPTSVVAVAATALPLIVLGRAAPAGLTLLTIGVFVLFELVAAGYLAAEAVRRQGSARVRFVVAAFATAAFALAIFAAGGSAAGAPADVTSAIARIVALVAGIGYMVAFLPPARLRRIWQATTAFDYLRRLVTAPVTEPPAALWTRLAAASRAATGGAVVVVARGPDGTTTVPAASGIAVSWNQQYGAPEFEELLLSADGGNVTSRSGAIVTDLSRLVAARFVTVVPIEVGGETSAALVVLGRKASLFSHDDTALLATIGAQTAALVERRAVLAEQERMAAQLAQTVDELRAANAAKSDFLASMSHELRTPLTAILGFSELMSGEQIVDERASVPVEWVEHIRRAGQHLLELINDVLDLSKVEAGRIDLNREPVDLVQAVGESLAGLRPLADRKRQQLEATVPQAVIEIDRGRLRQILYNLLSNAIKYTPEGGRVWVEGEVHGDVVRVTVADTGVGISTEDQAHVFEEFRQVGDPAAHETGTGLGLALTQRLVHAFGGRIELESTPGVGSRFSVVLPGVVDANATEPANVAAEAPRPTPTPQPGDVLIIEDDPAAVGLLRAYLEKDGYRVRVAADGAAGLAAARRQRPAAIVLDVLLPGIDGWDLLRILKSEEGLRDVPVIIVSVVDEREIGLALGAVDYFLKPIDPEALLACLARYAPTTKDRNVRVLAVDDDPAALRVIEATLGRDGYTFTGVTSGREALELVRRDRFDFVICDLVMPELSGFDVVAALQADPRTRDLPILILTAREVTNADKARLNGRILGIAGKGVTGENGLRSWLAQAIPGRVAPAEGPAA